MMEKEQGYENKSWNMPLEVGNPVWDLLITNTANMSRGWLTLVESEKRQMAEIILAPFAYEPEMLALFIQSVDERSSA
ncbi:MAG: hypothetical protein KC546_14840 [Anaerolineae bacterium]|nr:hypothetical protein [Anaerolineae bacterium]MCA9895478.1 hypothetical protein [Anaerolineae bacterium]